VVDLQRVRVGPVTLGDLPEGRWRPMSPAERAALVGGPRP
jgi:23S rRNA pseudouridine2604 synthase